jgi:ribosomal protein S18 acetylase RimI-like enzyme
MTSARELEPVQATAVTIRAATSDDVPALIAMVNAAYRRSEGHVFPTTDRVDRTDAMQHLARIVVAEIDGTLAGSIDLELAGGAAHFGMLATDVGLQGRGIASRLVQHAESVARSAGCHVMKIEVIREGGAIPFYERNGYRVTKETPGQTWNGGRDWGAAGPWHMVDMEKRL